MNVKSEARIYLISGEKQFLTKELALFLILCIIISWPVTLLIIAQLPPDFRTGDIEAFTNAAGSLNMLYGAGPMIAAIIVTLIYRKTSGLKALFSKVILWKVSWKWYALALVLPIIPEWIGLFLWSRLTGTVVVLPAAGNYLSSLLQIGVASTLYYIAEELGWRGFMLPRILSFFPWITASLLAGIIWAVWHYPIWITSTWATTGSVREVTLIVTANTIMIIALSALLTWIFKNTRGSVLLAMFLHGFNQANLTKMYTAAGDAALHGSSFIIVEAVMMAVMVGLVLLVVRNQE